MGKATHIAIAGIFVAGLLATPAAFAESGTTAAGGTPAANAGSSGKKTDKKMQSGAMSADKKKQHKSIQAEPPSLKLGDGSSPSQRSCAGPA